MVNLIRVRAAGGLGNQLLQYFGALYLTRELCQEIRFDLSEIDQSHTRGTLDIRSFLEPNQNLVIENYSKYTVKGLYLKMMRKLTRFIPLNQIIKQLDEDRSNIKNLTWEIQNNTGGFCTVEIRGWFANFEYYSLLPEEVRKLQLRTKSERFLKYSEQLINKNYVAVHLRFGDYFNNPSSYGILTKEYYARAFESLNVSLSNELVVVFSNDNSKVPEFLSIEGINSLIVVDDDPSFDPAEVLMLMSRASKLIISNSTFSYLSGLLSSPESMIAFPRYNVKGQEFITNTPNNWVEVTPDWL
ncbi:Alpha-1,2-fucosyltransferase [Candidatus Planktophila lacus]|uniref:alpha-1,2-fucosyltransferase n=1 Tax=Candidatus Planktophila lacus TaxID=1884913 RepID=UPI000BACC35D|nr:alpha-1,2-fucosyltransferase [Candidatus Planktophila lacus]ASY24510.1 Alpha-1,2-fucosyltransferase [Candidatus Planktophila lacus]